MKILVVDDDLAMMWTLVTLLKKWGAEVDSAVGARAGIALSHERDYDLVLLDFRMPDESGMWFLRNARLPAETQVLLVSSCMDRASREEARRLGVQAVIDKPFGGDELLQALERVVGKPSRAACAAQAAPV